MPVSLVDNRLDELIVERLHLNAKPLDIADWRHMLQRLRDPSQETTIAVVGKYIRHNDAYKSVYEALTHAGIALNSSVVIRKVEAEEVERLGAEEVLQGVDGLLVPGGFGHRGIDGKIEAIQYVREREIPFFGICLGLQCATIEFSRNVLGLGGANSTEMDPNTPHPVVCLLDDQFHITDKGGTMRLGSYPCNLKDGSKAQMAYAACQVYERHRHRYELNNRFRNQLEENGFLITGTSPDGNLVEVIELRGHPWFVAVQCHPEFKSKPIKAHPLFREFVQASLRQREGRKVGGGPRSRPQMTSVSGS